MAHSPTRFHCQSRILQPWHSWHFGMNYCSLWGAVLGIIGHLVLCLVSTYYVPWTSPLSMVTTKTVLRHCQLCPGAKELLAEKHCSRAICHHFWTGWLILNQTKQGLASIFDPLHAILHRPVKVSFLISDQIMSFPSLHFTQNKTRFFMWS